MKAIVVGSNGFLGRNIVQCLESLGWEVKSLSFRPQNEEFLSEAEELISTGVDYLAIAGACQVGGDSLQDLAQLTTSNVLMPVQLAEICSRLAPEAIVIHFGSSWQSDSLGKPNPFNLYAASKSAAEEMLRHFANKGLRIASLRLYDTYGDDDTRPKLLNFIVKAIRDKTPIDTTLGLQEFALIHVEDIFRAITSLQKLDWISLNNFAQFNLVPDEIYTVKEVIELACNISNNDPKDLFNFGARDYREGERMLVGQGPKMPNWRTMIPIQQGLSRLLED